MQPDRQYFGSSSTAEAVAQGGGAELEAVNAANKKLINHSVHTGPSTCSGATF
jgi:hypothetical protein